MLRNLTKVWAPSPKEERNSATKPCPVNAGRSLKVGLPREDIRVLRGGPGPGQLGGGTTMGNRLSTTEWWAEKAHPPLVEKRFPAVFPQPNCPRQGPPRWG